MLHTRASLGDTRKYSMPFTILVIDDDPLILEMATELPAEKGHRALSALGGSEGLAQARAEPPDLILPDYHMPRIDGLAVVQRLKSDAVTRRIPVVAPRPSRVHRLHPEAVRASRVSPDRRRDPKRDSWSRPARRKLKHLHIHLARPLRHLILPEFCFAGRTDSMGCARVEFALEKFLHRYPLVVQTELPAPSAE